MSIRFHPQGSLQLGRQSLRFAMPSICLSLSPPFPVPKNRDLTAIAGSAIRPIVVYDWRAGPFFSSDRKRSGKDRGGNTGVSHGTPRLILTTPDMQIDATGSMQIAQTYAGYRMRDTTMKKSSIEKRKKKKESVPLNWFSSPYARDLTLRLSLLLLLPLREWVYARARARKRERNI